MIQAQPEAENRTMPECTMRSGFFILTQNKKESNRMEKHFKLTDETITHEGVTLYRIVATKPLEHARVAAGDRGGFVQSEDNLRDNGWVADDAIVMENAVVRDRAQVRGNALVGGNAWIANDARVLDHAVITGSTNIMDHAAAYGNCFVRNASVSGTAVIAGYASIDGVDISIYGSAKVEDNAKIGGRVTIFDRAHIYGNAVVSGIAYIGGGARIYDSACIDGDAEITDSVGVAGDTVINCMDDFIVMHNNWTSGRAFIWTRSNNKWRVGCFYGTGEELIEKAYRDSEYKGKCYEAAVRYVEQLSKYREENER